MIKEDNFFINSRVINQNINKTKKIFNSFKEEFNSGKISFLESCTKDYKFEFSSRVIKKYSKFYINLEIENYGLSEDMFQIIMHMISQFIRQKNMLPKNKKEIL